MPTRFDLDTAVTPIAEGVFETRIDRGWWIVRGPNGGYIAAILARAIDATVGEAERPLRSLTVHYLRPPREGPAQVETIVERRGRTVTTVTARLMQGGKLQALATAAHAVPRQTGGFTHVTMPEVPPPDECPSRDTAGMAMHERYEQRFAIGPKFWEAERDAEAITGGWLRLREARPWDHAQLAAFCDAWPPAVFATRDMPETTGGVPTVDLTIHILAPEHVARLAPDDFVLVRFETRTVHGGYLEEDGEIWSPSGQLLAQCRQVGVVL
jgi:acyl-CoA thioesterase